MSRSFLAAGLLFFVIACKNKSAIPSNILSQKEMQAVLWDMMRADQFLNDYVFIRDTTANKVKESTLYYNQIFAIHKISADQFEKSFAFYKDHPILFRAIMDSMGKVSAEAPTQVVTPRVIDSNKTPVVRPHTEDTARTFRIRSRPMQGN